MTSFSRWLVYLGALGSAFALGRFVLPSTSGPLGQRKTAESQAARQRFWSDKLQSIKAEQPAAMHQAAILELMDKLVPGDFANVLPSFRDDEVNFPIFAALWAQIDRESLFTYVANTGSVKSKENQTLAAHLLMEQALTDLPAAEAAASRLRLPGESFDSFKPVALALLRSDVKKGIAFLARHPLCLTDAEVLRELEAGDLQAPNWTEKTIEARIAWLDGLPAAPWRDRTIEELYAHWATENPEGVLTAAQQRGATARHMLPAVRTWFQRDAAAAEAFFQNRAKDEVKSALAVALAERKAAADPQAAWDFARWELSGSARTEACQRVLSTVSAKDPATAARWMGDMARTPWRVAALQEIAQKWNEMDPAAAQDWLAGLSADDQSKLK